MSRTCGGTSYNLNKLALSFHYVGPEMDLRLSGLLEVPLLTEPGIYFLQMKLFICPAGSRVSSM